MQHGMFIHIYIRDGNVDFIGFEDFLPCLSNVTIGPHTYMCKGVSRLERRRAMGWRDQNCTKTLSN